MGGGDEKPPLMPAGASTDCANAVELEVRPEFSMIAPCGPPSGRGQARDSVMVMARVKARRESDGDRRAPVNICAVIDRSESMKTNIALVKQSLEFMVQQLRDEDQLSLLVFDHEVATILPMTYMTLQGKESAVQAFGKLKERGQTNLSGGLLAGLQQFLTMNPNPQDRARVESVLLFTDGKANRGITDGNTLTRATRSVVAQIGRQVSVFTFGFSEEHEANVLQSIAEAGNGLYYYVADVESIPDSFCDCLGGLLSVTAQNITLEIEGLNGHLLDRPLTTFAVNSSKPNCYTVQIPDIYSEESKDILVNVALCIKGEFDLDNPRPVPTEVLQCHVSYFDVLTCKICNVEATACVSILPPAITAEELGMELEEKLTIADTDVALQRIRQSTNIALRDADRLASGNDRAGAVEQIDRCVRVIETSPLSQDTFAQHQMMTLLTAKAGISDQREYKRFGAKHVRGLVHANEQQRSNTNPVIPSPAPMAAAASASRPAYSVPMPPPLPSQAAAASYLGSSASAAAPYPVSVAPPPAYAKPYNPYRKKAKVEMMDEWKKHKGKKEEEE
ncbi:uncharacterized protein LOC135808238 [Sycon ciliatum]|uniref:uncharacterized protein LOC135808238 n=1 Tax=Sycon ciliatum TaxID=27933 RepID=UPI0020ABCD9D|eukprot:scpid60428/ scgid30262/ Uncharacterized protein sll0103